MAKSDSTICFRVPVKERNLLEAVAHYADQTLSEFARSNLILAAEAILQRVGVEAVMEKDRQFEERRLQEAAAKMQARFEDISGQRSGSQ
jgi:uncharacterized protein (DUF1778 family)